MCCFTGPVQWVSKTKIFARPADDGAQLLVYAMSFAAKDELAMVLPLPVPKKTADDAVKFVSFEKYPEFFREMQAGFPIPRAAFGPATRGPALGGALPKPLPVVEVGSYEASFVPAVADFKRLDERFRLPDGVWEKLPGYKEFGFAVFKLKAGEQNVHPMAFWFPRKNTRQIFFPTVHIHDGEVHDSADFDHDLFLQLASAEDRPPRNWVESTQPAGMFLKLDRIKGLLDPELHCYRHQIVGKLKNQDVLV